MKFSRMSPTDRDALVALWRDSVTATHTFLTQHDIDELEIAVRDQALPALEVWVLRDESERVVGFMGLDDSRLEALFLASAQIGQGYGRQMLAFARNLKGPLQLDVNEQNARATAFYLANGFKIIGRSETDSDGRPFPILHLQE
jgi:putative acetyltransferase